MCWMLAAKSKTLQPNFSDCIMQHKLAHLKTTVDDA